MPFTATSFSGFGREGAFSLLTALLFYVLQKWPKKLWTLSLNTFRTGHGNSSFKQQRLQRQNAFSMYCSTMR